MTERWGHIEGKWDIVWVRGGFRRIYLSSSYMCINYELFVLCTRSTVFFVHFFAVVFAWLQREANYTFYGGNVACVPFCFFFFFSLLLIFTLLAASISHFLTAPIKFSCFSSNEIGFLYLFISRSSSCSVINIKVDIEI